MRIVVLDGHVLNPGDNPWTPLESLGEVIVYDRTPQELITTRAADATVVLTNKARLDKDIIDALPALRYIGVLATGYDVVDLQAAASHTIPVCNVVAYGVEDVAQHVFALTLELCRRCSDHTQSVRDGEWAGAEDWCYWKYTPLCLSGLTMGIIGFGNIGQKVGELAHAFGMSVLAHVRSPRPAPNYAPFAYTDLDTLLSSSHVISLHCPLTEKSHHLINDATLAQMRSGAFLINTARGPLLDENAVARSLHAGHLGGLGVDVLSTEPPQTDNPLLSTPNTLITPHIAWATTKARRNITRLAAENIRCWMDGAPRNVVNAALMA